MEEKKAKHFTYYGIMESPVCPCCNETLILNAATIKVFVVCEKCKEVFPTDTRTIDTKH